MAQARTYFRPEAAREAAIKAGIPSDLVILIHNEQTGRYSYRSLHASADGPALPPPPAPLAVARKRQARPAKTREPERIVESSDRYTPHRTLVVLDLDILERIEVARRRVKPGARVPNRSELIRDILRSKLPQASAG